LSASQQNNVMGKPQIGLIGFGTVGSGFYKLASEDEAFDLKTIVAKSKEKKRDFLRQDLKFDKNLVLQDGDIDVLIELIDDAEEAKLIVEEALRRGKSVISANKKLIASNMQHFYDLQKDSHGRLIYEAAVAASIPVFRIIEQYFRNENIQSLSAILNGTSNYILTKMLDEGRPYAEVLAEAHFGVVADVDSIPVFGIDRVSEADVQYAQKRGWTIKHTASGRVNDAGEVELRVGPQFIPTSHWHYRVQNEYNAILLEGEILGEQFFVGKGAGSLPTGYAVYQDLNSLNKGYNYEYLKMKNSKLSVAESTEYDVYLSSRNKSLLKNISKKSSIFEQQGEIFITAVRINSDTISSIGREFNPNELSLIYL